MHQTTSIIMTLNDDKSFEVFGDTEGVKVQEVGEQGYYLKKCSDHHKILQIVTSGILRKTEDLVEILGFVPTNFPETESFRFRETFNISVRISQEIEFEVEDSAERQRERLEREYAEAVETQLQEAIDCLDLEDSLEGVLEGYNTPEVEIMRFD